MYGCSISITNAIKQNGKKIQSNKPIFETFIGNLRLFMASAFPILHILFLFVCVFNYDKIYEESLEKAKKEFEIF